MSGKRRATGALKDARPAYFDGGEAVCGICNFVYFSEAEYEAHLPLTKHREAEEEVKRRFATMTFHFSFAGCDEEAASA